MGTDVLMTEGVESNVLSFNELYAKQREWQISCGGNIFLFGLAAPNEIASECIHLDLSIGTEDLGISFCKFPQPSMLSNSFGEGIDINSLSGEISFLVIEAAASEILSKAESFFRYNVALSRFSKVPHSTTTQDEICMYLKTPDDSFATDFYISGTPEIMKFIRKKIAETMPKKIHKFNSVPLEYSIELGRTYLTNEEYSSINQNDIIFIEINHLSSGQSIPIKGLGITATIADGKVIADRKPIL
ncbi:MAG: hypothetical protein LBI37_03030 [Puniceicoccales bacterium]|jgi:hypothetical protein|nr:hypothetical protein [Puniceicoccales bacterium]